MTDFITYFEAKYQGHSSSSLSQGWNAVADKKHLFKIYSDEDVVDGENGKILFSSNESETLSGNIFSTMLDQQLNNTKIVEENGIERIELELDDRIVTIIMDQSGSMTWNDNGGSRYLLAKTIIERMEENYPGEIKYNLISYGGTEVEPILFAIREDDLISSDYQTVSQILFANSRDGFAGIRVIRNEEREPISVTDGEEIGDGFFSRILDEDLKNGQRYFYKVYTYDSNLRFSTGIPIFVTPRIREIPRGISMFETIPDAFPDIEENGYGVALKGKGTHKDKYTLALWQMNEGAGNLLYNFGTSNMMLTHSSTSPRWIGGIYSISGTNGIIFIDGEDDYAFTGDADGGLSVDCSNSPITIHAWIFPYSIEGTSCILYRGNNDSSFANYRLDIIDGYLRATVNNATIPQTFSSSDIMIENNKWQYVVFSYSGTEAFFVVNGEQSENYLIGSEFNIEDMPSSESDSILYVGKDPSNNYFKGRMSEVGVCNIARDIEWIENQILITVDEDSQTVNYSGIKEDNGDRLVVLKYEIPSDYNFEGGNIRIVRNEKRMPSWENDGDIIYEEEASIGEHILQDNYDFVIGETYYYRLFSQNSIGNYCFNADAYSLSIQISSLDSTEYLPSIDEAMPSPIGSTYASPITEGNRKNYIRWEHPSPEDDNILMAKLYYSTYDYPIIRGDGQGNGELLYTWSFTDNERYANRRRLDGVTETLLDYYYVHNNIENNKTYYYTIIFIDRYGRVSNYVSDNDGRLVFDGNSPSIGGNHLKMVGKPSSTSSNSAMPPEDIANIKYEIRDENSLSIKWDLPITQTEQEIEAYFDETILVYASLNDEFGDKLPDGALIKLIVTPYIERTSDRYDDIFDDIQYETFEDSEAFEFNVSKDRNGILMGTLRLSSNDAIVSQILSADFSIQLKAVMQKDSFVSENDGTSNSNNPLEQYLELIDNTIDWIEGGAEEVVSNESIFFEYRSKPIRIKFKNPWKITLLNRDNRKVYQDCFCMSDSHDITINKIPYNGIYMKSSSPYVARAKVEYKGEPLSSGSIQVAIWDALTNNAQNGDSILCDGACGENPTATWGEWVQKSVDVTVPYEYMDIIRGYEDLYEEYGEHILNPISYVDIPIYAPDKFCAIRLFVKTIGSGYGSIQNTYILFQNILKINITTDSPSVDGKTISEQRASVYLVDPDYPDDESLYSYPSANTPVKFELNPIKIEGVDMPSFSRNLYTTLSTGLVSESGIYSLTTSGGTARFVFLGPIYPGESGETGDVIANEGWISIGYEDIIEDYSLTVTVENYNGMTAFAVGVIKIRYTAGDTILPSGYFLMEVDGGYNDSGEWVPWSINNSDTSLLWADGKSYRRMMIHRNPYNVLGDTDFKFSEEFATCVINNENNRTYELSYEQVVNINAGDGMEILHGDIIEAYDPSIEEHYLIIGENGYVDNGTASVTLSKTSDVTYFYIRAAVDSYSGHIVYNNCIHPNETLNYSCESLGILCKHTPEWSIVKNISGVTDVLVDGELYSLYGGGSIEEGVPPNVICVKDPLSLQIVNRRVVNYGIDSEGVSYPIEYDDVKRNFCDYDGNSLLRHTSNTSMRIAVSWKGEPVPDGTRVYIKINDNKMGSYFIADQLYYETKTMGDDPSEEGYSEGYVYSYVDVNINVQRIPIGKYIVEDLQAYCYYDERGDIERKAYLKGSDGQALPEKLSLDYKNTPIPIPVPEGSEMPTPIIDDTYTKTVHKYIISSNTWEQVSDMSERKGSFFVSSVDNFIYVLGGLKNDEKDISNKVEVYDAEENLWTTAEAMPSPRFGGMTVVYGTSIYCIGGVESDGYNLRASSKVSVYDTSPSAGEAWQTDVTPIPTAIAYGEAILTYIEDNPYIYIFGGVNSLYFEKNVLRITDSDYNQYVWRYNINEDVWESFYVDIAESKRMFFSLIEVGETIVPSNGVYYILNANDEILEQYLSVNYALTKEVNIEDSEIIYNGQLENLVNRAECSVVKDDVGIIEYYLMGGRNSSANALKLVEKIGINSSVISYTNSYAEEEILSMPPAKYGHGSAISYDALAEKCIYVIGGYVVNREDSN